jgi:hypothetical protein
LPRAALECEFINEHSAGDHVLVPGKVIGGKLLDSEAEPMSYRETGSMDGEPIGKADRWSSTREVAQIGATIGRRFSYELISAVAPMPLHQLDFDLFILGYPNQALCEEVCNHCEAAGI